MSSFITTLTSIFFLDIVSTGGALHTLSFQQLRPEDYISPLSFTHTKKEENYIFKQKTS